MSRPDPRVLFAALLCAVAASTPATLRAQARLAPEEAAIAAWIDEHLDEAIDLLEESVNINSGTTNLEGVRRVADHLAPHFEALGMEVEWIPLPESMNRAGHLFARQEGRTGKRILLIGHLDTVFEEDDTFQTFVRDGRSARGPGVADMKAGNVAILYALRALAAVGALEDASVVVALTGDEESPGEPVEVTRAPLVEAGRWADVALGFEGAMRDVDGEYATVARRSASEWMLEVSGRQAHSSGVFSEGVGAGAIFEAARILNAFYEEVRGEEYLTFNAGSILGGTDVAYDAGHTRGTVFGKTNVVPNRVVVHGGIRTISAEQLERARRAMREVVARHLPHTDATITFSDGYPAMAPTDGNMALYEMMSEVSEAVGLGPMRVLDPGRRGAADISFVAPWVDGLAGVGVHGSGSHTPQERVDLESLAPAMKRAAILVYRLTRMEPGPMAR